MTERPIPDSSSGADPAAPPPGDGEPAGATTTSRAHESPPRTRVGLAFNGFTAGAVVLVLLLIFILENTASVKVSYLGTSAHLALGVALLLAAVGGALLVGILGMARIAQLRRHARRHRPRH